MRVLIATDFSTQADKARGLVAGLGLPQGSQIRVVHAIEPMPGVTSFAPAAITTMAEAARREAQAELERLATTLRAAGRGVDTTLAVGRAADVVADEAARFAPDLLVIGNRGRGGVASAVLGSVSAEIVDRARCPVLVARRDTLTRLVLADDGSASAAAGADLVTRLPAFAGLPVRVVSVVDAPFPYALGSGDNPMGSYAAVQAYHDSLVTLRAEHERIAHERVAQLAAAGLKATSEVREGDAAAQLVDAAEADHADCIVIGSRGRTGLTRLVLGSVARGVLFHALCSVLVIHAPVVSSPATGKRELVSTAR